MQAAATLIQLLNSHQVITITMFVTVKMTRVVNIWNSLPDSVVDADMLNTGLIKMFFTIFIPS